MKLAEGKAYSSSSQRLRISPKAAGFVQFSQQIVHQPAQSVTSLQPQPSIGLRQNKGQPFSRVRSDQSLRTRLTIYSNTGCAPRMMSIRGSVWASAYSKAAGNESQTIRRFCVPVRLGIVVGARFILPAIVRPVQRMARGRQPVGCRMRRLIPNILPHPFRHAALVVIPLMPPHKNRGGNRRRRHGKGQGIRRHSRHEPIQMSFIQGRNRSRRTRCRTGITGCPHRRDSSSVMARAEFDIEPCHASPSSVQIVGNNERPEWLHRQADLTRPRSQMISTLLPATGQTCSTASMSSPQPDSDRLSSPSQTAAHHDHLIRIAHLSGKTHCCAWPVSLENPPRTDCTAR